jgi:hypothetical protein
MRLLSKRLEPPLNSHGEGRRTALLMTGAASPMGSERWLLDWVSAGMIVDEF